MNKQNVVNHTNSNLAGINWQRALEIKMAIVKESDEEEKEKYKTLRLCLVWGFREGKGQ